MREENMGPELDKRPSWSNYALVAVLSLSGLAILSDWIGLESIAKFFWFVLGVTAIGLAVAFYRIYYRRL
jgi:hypothetical protein